MRIAGHDHNVVTTERRTSGPESCLAAYKAGYRVFDSADLYGGRRVVTRDAWHFTNTPAPAIEAY